MSIKQKLRRMKSHMSHDHKPSIITEEQKHKEINIPSLNEWKELSCEPYYFDEQYSLIRKIKYPIHHKHGKHSFHTLAEIISEWENHHLDHPLSTANVNLGDLLFFDTETTGLSSGAGNYIFLIGYATVRDDEVTVTQHILPNPSAEVAMYAAFLADFHENTKLISFNGKAFDWPQVKTRHVFVRDKVPKLPQFAHFDLLHASRRLWKRILPSCKLAVVEKDILQFERKNDIPGYLAPMLYFDFLNEQEPQLLESVLLHNEWDVLSLISLYIEISCKLLNNKLVTYHPIEYEEIGHWFETLGQNLIAISFYEKALKENERAELYVKLAKCYKKINDYEKSREILEEGFNRCSYFPIEGMIELAKLYEHQLKDYEKALFYTEEAYLQWKNRTRLLKMNQEEIMDDLNVRVNRLNKKIIQGNH